MSEVIRIIGDPVLRLKSAEVSTFDQELKDMVMDMYEEMIEADGVGLAAPQIGISKKVIVMGLEDDDDQLQLFAFVNPVILESSGKCVMEEGCLSIPDIREDVERPDKVKLRWHDLEGELHEEWFDELHARIIQHELDHLEGILFVDRLTPTRRSSLKGQISKLQKKN
jgi:peptide deformylase